MDKKNINSLILPETNEAGAIAYFYGFFPIKPPAIAKRDLELTKNFKFDFLAKEKSAITHLYFEQKMMAEPQPVMFYCEHPFPESKEKKKNSKLDCSLFALGSSKSVIECLSIQTAISILNKLGYKDLTVNLNSIGDKESIVEFNRKLLGFVRKNMNSFPPELRQLAKKDIYAVLSQDKKEWQCHLNDCPKSIDFLSEQSRNHFKEVLEFLEIMDIPYVINHNLVGDINIGAETIFDIRENDEILATGMRFNRLAKKIGYKKDLPSSIVHIEAKIKKPLKKTKIKKTIPKFYLVQFGPEAKLKSFLILKHFYKANIPITHSIAKDKLGSQIGIAENSGSSYVVLIGQKEAIENSVIMRSTATRAQESVPINEIGTKIKDMIK